MSLQLERVTLYKNDLAFYERGTQIMGDESISTPPSFRTKIMIPQASKDLIVDTLSVRAPGLVVVNYDTELRDTIADQDSQEDTFRFRRDTYAEFLKSCSGASIEFTKLGEGDQPPHKGVILTVEDKIVPLAGREGATIEEKVLSVVVDGRKIHTVFLKDLDSVTLLDSYLQDQLVRMLAKAYESHKPVKKATGDTSIFISTTGEGVKQGEHLNVSYIDRAEEWKCSYRLEIPSEEVLDKQQAGGGKEAEEGKEKHPSLHLHMFGQVEKATTENWKDIGLRLVANELEISKEVKERKGSAWHN